jgi:hypothetical protein
VWAASSTGGLGVNRTAISIGYCPSDSVAIAFAQRNADPVVHSNAHAIIHCNA